jgi:hypothetical protein
MVKRGVVWRRWQRALSEYWDSDLTVSEYCRRHGLCSKTAWIWAKRLRSEQKAVADTLEIVPVKLTLQVELPGLPRLSPQADRDSGIHLELGTLQVRLSADFDVEALRRVLSVLEVR